jgi:hypothetical protein
MSSEQVSREESEPRDSSYGREEIAADLRKLVTRIEDIHPEPYLGYDGRVDLHTTLEATVRNLPESATTEEIYRLSADLVAGLEDAHSRVIPPDGDDSEGDRLPISLRLVGESIYVDEVYDESLEDLLGAKLLGIEGESTDAMADRYEHLRGSENRYFARMALADKIEANKWLDRLLDREPAPSTPTLRFRTGEDDVHRRSLEPISPDSEPVRGLEKSMGRPDGTGPRYGLYDDGQVAVFVPGNLMTYREVIEAARERGAGYTESIASDAYEEHYDDEPPETVEDIVPELPSMVETLTDLVREMEKANTESLVVDLRDNPGGDSRFVQYIGYFVYGWEQVIDGSDWNMALKRRTEAHQERFGVPESAEDEFATFEENPAGYDFGNRFRSEEKGFDEQKQRLRDSLASDAFEAELEDETHEGYYEPEQVVVATTAGTMSSGFAGAALLSELGADVVGVPSGQAPLSFGEAVEVELPNTALNVDIAGSMYRWTRNPESDVLPMECELTEALFEQRYDRAGDAALQLALDWASGAQLQPDDTHE